MLGKLDRFLGRIGAGAGDHGHAALGLVDAPLDHPLCSSWLTVGLSPVVPTGTSPCVPSVICQLTSERKAASSSEPF